MELILAMNNKLFFSKRHSLAFWIMLVVIVFSMAAGCEFINDSDEDGINDRRDECPGTSAGEVVDRRGCSFLQQDSDGDGVLNGLDLCPDTLADEAVDENGCSDSPPVRVVIAIDDSGSMIDSDPGDFTTGIPMRLQAAWDFIDSYRDFDSVQFDVIHWNNTIARTTGGFSRNFTDLYDDVFTYNIQSTTNYTLTLSTIEEHFVQEISAMRNDEVLSANIARMRCIVIFFSDGLPNPWTEISYYPIYQQITMMKNRIVDIEGASSFTFNAFLLSSGLMDEPALLNQAQTLMMAMASVGDGVFKEFLEASEINFINTVNVLP